MKFGKIDYINLLPFYVFIKKNIKNSRIKQSIGYKKSYPSEINRKFRKKEVNIAFISSIESNKRDIRCKNIGIVAKKEVISVLIDPKKSGDDSESATSNMLAKVLNIKGKVIIGDKALKLYLKNPNYYIDLAKIWREKTDLPFVFARLCFNKKSPFFEKLTDKFINTKVKIPQYILNNYAKKRGISKKDILKYLKLISYKIDYKSQKSLKIFFKKTKKINTTKHKIH